MDVLTAVVAVLVVIGGLLLADATGDDGSAAACAFRRARTSLVTLQRQPWSATAHGLASDARRGWADLRIRIAASFDGLMARVRHAYGPLDRT